MLGEKFRSTAGGAQETDDTRTLGPPHPSPAPQLHHPNPTSGLQTPGICKVFSFAVNLLGPNAPQCPALLPSTWVKLPTTLGLNSAEQIATPTPQHHCSLLG